MNDTLVTLLALTYVVAVIAAAEGLRRKAGFSSDFTRKVVHIAVGMMVWVVPFLFSSPWPFVMIALLFALINLLDWRFGFFAAMASSDRSNLGTVYFPLAAAVVVVIFWDRPPLMVAALMPLTWGDGIAPIVGRAFGRHAYTVMGHRRTLQGSAGFFVAGLLFTWLALWLIPGPPTIAPVNALLVALVIMGSTTLVEAVSLWGMDNLTVTGAAMAILALWPF